MRYKNLAIVTLAVSVMMMVGCSHMPAGLAPSVSPLDGGAVTVLGHATGEASYFSLLGIIPFGKPDYDAAIKDAISKFPGGTSLINVRSTSSTTFALVGFIKKLTVYGDVVAIDTVPLPEKPAR